MSTGKAAGGPSMFLSLPAGYFAQVKTPVNDSR
jgi:hypothetical protein